MIHCSRCIQCIQILFEKELKKVVNQRHREQGKKHFPDDRQNVAASGIAFQSMKPAGFLLFGLTHLRSPHVLNSKRVGNCILL